MKEFHLKLIAITALLIASGLSVAYGLEPTEFAQKVGANENLIKELSDACTKAEDSKHCFGIWLAISNAETQMGKAKTNHWYFGRKGSKDKSAYWFVAVYNQKYYIPSKYNEWWMFYWYWPNKPAPTHYCMSETSSNSQWYCPNGRKSFNAIYSAYKKEVLEDNIIQPPLSDNILEPVNVDTGHNIKLTGRKCRIIHTVAPWEIIEIKHKGILRYLIDYLWIWDKITVCS